MDADRRRDLFDESLVIARLIVESEVARLAALSLPALRRDALAGGCDVKLVDVVEACVLLLHTRLTENDLAALKDQIEADVRGGLLDRRR